MSKKYQEGILPFKVVATDEPLIARGGLVLPYEFGRAIKLPEVIDRELPPPGSGRALNLFQGIPICYAFSIDAAWWGKET